MLKQLSDLDLVFDVPGPDVVRLAQSDSSSVVELESLKGQVFDAELVEPFPKRARSGFGSSWCADPRGYGWQYRYILGNRKRTQIATL